MPTPKCRFLESLFLRHGRELLAFAGRRAGSEAAEDVVQDTYLRLLQHPDPQSIEHPRAFLYQTAANLSIDRHRRQQVREAVLGQSDGDEDGQSQSVDPAPTPEQQWLLRDDLEKLNSVLSELPEVTAFAFVLYRIDGLPHREIAERLGISESSSARHVRLAARHVLSRFGAFDE